MTEAALADLPATFTYGQARRGGLSDRNLHRLRDNGTIELVSRGLYRRTDTEPADLDLLEIAHRAPDATLCLATALASHDLTDLIPASIDVAIPRTQRPARVQAPVSWHRFDPATFLLGRETLQVDRDTSIGIYSAERSIIDAFRLRHREGPELGTIALRRWLNRRAAQPSALLAMAQSFPHAQRALRDALEVLL